MAKHGAKGLTRMELAQRTNDWMHMLYQAFGGPEKPEKFSNDLWYELAGKPAEYSPAVFSRTARLLSNIGILSRDRGQEGRAIVFSWTLLKPEAEAVEMVDKFFRDGGVIATEQELALLDATRKRQIAAKRSAAKPHHSQGARLGDGTDFRQQPKVAIGGPITRITPADMPKVALAASPAEEVRAVAGPEPEKPMAPLATLRPETVNPVVEQARIYASRYKAIDKSLDQMAALASNLGVKFDRKVAFESFELEEDARMEILLEVLPYITTLEQRVERLTADNTELREIKRNYGGLVNENERLKGRIKTLVSERVPATVHGN